MKQNHSMTCISDAYYLYQEFFHRWWGRETKNRKGEDNKSLYCSVCICWDVTCSTGL